MITPRDNATEAAVVSGIDVLPVENLPMAVMHLTGEAEIAANNVGKIDIFDFWSYVAVKREVADKALQRLETGRIKGRTFKVKFI